MISAKVIADSKNPQGNRITTFVITFPRYILAEFNTHRMLSKNSASSRAIPFEKLLKSVGENPFIPIAWQKDHKGMQGTEYHTNEDNIYGIKAGWLHARDNAIISAKDLSKMDVTKQLVNRLLEPFMYHTVIVTGTEWENFFHLRCPKYARPYTITDGDKTIGGDTLCRSKKEWLRDCTLEYIKAEAPNTDLEWLKINRGQADIHMMALAEAIWDAYNESEPKELKGGEWHIPFGDLIHEDIIDLDVIKISTAMCARVSYTIVGEESKAPSYVKDIELHDRLAQSGHWSPFEHCAQCLNENNFDDTGNMWSGNFYGFKQYRKTFQNENITK